MKHRSIVRQYLKNAHKAGLWLTLGALNSIAIAHPPTAPDTQSRIHYELDLPVINNASLNLFDLNDSEAPDSNSFSEVVIAKGDSLSKVFGDLDLDYAQLLSITANADAKKIFRSMRPGDQLEFEIDPLGKLQGLHYKIDASHIFSVARSGEAFTSELIELHSEIRETHTSATIQSSLFVAGNEAGLSNTVIMQLANIFGWDIDFSLDIRAGDKFTLVYEEYYRDGEKLKDGNILAAEFINQGHSFRAYRFEKPDGTAEYYSPDGHSMRKAFLRSPVDFARIASRFNPHRMHPILHKVRAHKGVDYAAATGTPIRSAGDGRITYRARKGGYGRVITVQHGQKYSTLYAHMSSYKSGLKTGSRVRQGQIIGYVGQSGRATGPHLHYEFRVNGVHRDPLRVKLPDAKPIKDEYRIAFLQIASNYDLQLNTLGRSYIAQLTP